MNSILSLPFAFLFIMTKLNALVKYFNCINHLIITKDRNEQINLLRRDPIMSGIQRFALALTIIGAINWGLIGFFQFDLVASIFGGQDAALSRIVYGLVGIAGLINLGLLFKPSEEVERSHATDGIR
jgi:uncharacterized protein